MSEIHEKKTTIWTPDFISTCVIGVLLNIGKQMSGSILSVYVNTLADNATIVGLVASAFSVSAIAFKLFSGAALDAFNRRNVLLIAMLGLSVTFVGYGLSRSVATVVAFRFLQGACQAFTATCLLAMASDSLPADKLSSGISIFTLAEGISSAIGPTIGLKCVDLVGYNRTFIISAVIMLSSALSLLVYKVPFERKNKFKITIDKIFSRKCLVFAVILFAFNFTNCVVSSFLVIFSGEQGVAGNIGLYFTLNAMALMVTRPLVGKLTDHFGIVKIAIPGMCAFIASFWIISFSHSLPAFLTAALVSAFGFGACQPAIQALCMKCVTKEERGVASNTCYLAQDFGNLLGPIVAGLVVESFGYCNMWRIMTIPIMITAVYTFFVRKRIASVEENFLSLATSE